MSNPREKRKGTALPTAPRRTYGTTISLGALTRDRLRRFQVAGGWRSADETIRAILDACSDDANTIKRAQIERQLAALSA